VKASTRAIHACLEQGITSIDTAPVYGFGLSERIVGEALKGKRDRYEILTKSGLRWEGTMGVHHFSTIDNDGKPCEVYKYAGRESIIRECEDSLRRLGTDYIDLYQIHWPDDSTPIEETMDALQKLIDQGKIRAAGVSNYNLDQMALAASVIDLASNQLPYSMLRRDIEKDIVPWCLANDCAILAYSPLQRGLLAGRIGTETHFNEGDSRAGLPHYRKDNIIKTRRFLDSIRSIADTHGATLAQVVLHWTLRQPGISVVLAGARNEEQVLENAGTAKLRLDEEELARIDHLLEGLELDLD
jgi:aryl-alcohol dehydrogenase-like predicted oxidoreductase